MRRELERIAEEVSALCGGARVFVLPYPYRSGHFRVYSDVQPVKSADYSVQRRGGNLFVTIGEKRLLEALVQMEQSTPCVSIAPQKSAFATLLYQIMRKNWEPCEADEPQLVRMALEMDEEAARCGHIIKQMEPLLGKAYAQALRQGRQYSVLTAVARQAVYHMQLHDL